MIRNRGSVGFSAEVGWVDYTLRVAYPTDPKTRRCKMMKGKDDGD